MLRGTLADRTIGGEVVIDVHGVGYRATVAPATIGRLGDPGADVVVHTHLHVRDDALTLYAFPTRAERDCFEALLSAHGVGPGLALAILSVHSPDNLRRLLAETDVDALTLVPGVGKKTAIRLMVELKARLDVDNLGTDDDHLLHAHDTNGGPSSRADLRIALAGLGYETDEIRAALRQVPDEGSLDELLRAALRTLAASR